MNKPRDRSELDQPNYTIKTAAKRVDRSTRTIERWIRDGMDCRTAAGQIIIDHHVLLKEYRKRILNNPNNTRHAQSRQ